MGMTDPIGDFLTRIRNAALAGHASCECPNSKVKRAIAQILKEEGFIEDFVVLDDRCQGVIHVDLRYVEKVPAIVKMERVSRPGRRSYTGWDELPRVLNGMGVAIVSTPKGIMTDKKARKLRLGGEVLCTVY
jgi:small subunit ribosomal protein S8